jgi:hypothetical protein
MKNLSRVSRKHYFCIRPLEQILCPSVISVLRRDVEEIWALLGYYAASGRNPLPTFRYNVSVPSSTVRKSKKKRKPARRYAVYAGKGVGGKDGTDTLSRNVGKGLPLPPPTPSVYRLNFITSCRLSFLLGLLDPWRWDRYANPKRRKRIATPTTHTVCI